MRLTIELTIDLPRSLFFTSGLPSDRSWREGSVPIRWMSPLGSPSRLRSLSSASRLGSDLVGADLVTSLLGADLVTSLLE
jgi:hypothetical protein